MNDSELKRYIDQAIENKMNIILHGVTGDAASSDNTETIQQLFPGQDGIKKRPVMHPYGFVSRAPDGIISVIGRIGAHVANRFVMGHRDKGRPSDLNSGESYLYSTGKYQLRVKNGKVEVGKDGVYQTLVVGEDLQAALIAIIDAIVAHTHIGNLGAPTSPPQNAATFTQIKTDQVAGGKLLAKDGGKF